MFASAYCAHKKAGSTSGALAARAAATSVLAEQPLAFGDGVLERRAPAATAPKLQQGQHDGVDVQNLPLGMSLAFSQELDIALQG